MGRIHIILSNGESIWPPFCQYLGEIIDLKLREQCPKPGHGTSTLLLRSYLQKCCGKPREISHWIKNLFYFFSSVAMILPLKNTLKVIFYPLKASFQNNAALVFWLCFKQKQKTSLECLKVDGFNAGP